jgi:2-polyprenyl-3-methyl-5-hydroxy-6-metoxy-1,4-benzoquinol methylase
MYRLHGTPYDRGITRFIQQARVAAVLRLAEVRSNDRELEIGCESGRLLAQVPACGRLVGADISEAALVDASSHLASRNPTVELVQVDVQRRLPFAPGEFDVVICSEMLEHVVDPRAAVEHLHAAVDRKARVVLSIPIEAPKLAIKRALAAVGLLGLLFPGIEPGRSEWHLHAFSRRMLLEITRGLFRADRSAVVWGCHYVARFAKL